MMATHPKALALIAGIFAGILTPQAPMTPSAWAKENLVVPDGPRAGSRWDLSLTPYVPEIIDALGPDSPHNMVAVRKSQQTGISVAGIALVGAYIDQAPCRIAYAVPRQEDIGEFNREKLGPSIAGTKSLKAKVRGQMSRSGEGSTQTSKRFPGGSLKLLNAGVATELKSKTLKVGIGDEVDEWAFDLDGQGDAFDLFLGRFTAFHATGDWRVLALSTPTLAKTSRIDRLFKDGDQRFWHIRCPGCDDEIVLTYEHLKHNDHPPFQAYYAAPCCGRPIEHHEKAGLVRAGRFVATNPDGLYPSFHVDALISQLTTWDKLAEAAVAAHKSESKDKTFHNLWLGLPYEMRGNAPEWERLMERREASLVRGVVPAKGLILVAGCDVQHNGLPVEVVAFGEDRQSWSIEALFLEGPTDDPKAGAWTALEALLARRFTDIYGQERRIEAMAVDSGDGGRTTQVLEWCRQHAGAYAIKGVAGRGVPAIGLPSKKSVTKGGKRKRYGSALAWPVGTWGLKSELYANLHKSGAAAGGEIDPPGYCHFGPFHDAEYFKQLTAEYFDQQIVRGRMQEDWKRARRENHFLDARIYAMAMAEHLGLSRLTPDGWARLRARVLPSPQADMLSPAAMQIAGTGDIEAKAEGLPVKPKKPRQSPAEISSRLNR
ncbi:phage terminase large subunit family protein [Aurantimonas sp. VKM B-3413]|uniref:phage terminase large subunit family protein n=1 Tax=Aurantimonas sp. VKM B-3413 TaxID=2779401 RepID=UPI001E2A6532|nr:terminase gpA endonuclease subunit [Aurantimonas sp. VKM B-3413]MCB8835949.1 phage terminase large subunit family protein [Aurantimonas sp. VKM B-3413]